MERGKGDGKGNDGQGGRRSEERGTVKHRRKRERWTVDKGMMERGKGDGKGTIDNGGDGQRKGGGKGNDGQWTRG